MLIKQLSIFVENKVGRLAEITEIIAKHNINIEALSIADTTNFGILRIIVADPYAAEKILKEEGLTVSVTSVISVALRDKPGSLSEVLRLLAEKKITVEYMYAFVSNPEEDHAAYVIMRIEDEFNAMKLLEDTGFHGLKRD